MATTTGRRTGAWTPWLYLAPALLLLGGLLVYPVYQLGLISFLEYTQAQVSGGEPTTFQGLGNYATLFADEPSRDPGRSRPRSTPSGASSNRRNSAATSSTA
ncbi:hypothetical protein ACFVY1_28655 [Streptomyces sp. NPDC058293]|uniref:hypothetical protein n=1 Tax=Streptomyces sp. NPDC058293 TaxID=3346429 RepID=UPI0036E21F4B